MSVVDLVAIREALSGLLDGVAATAGLPVASMSGREHIAAPEAISVLDAEIGKVGKEASQVEVPLMFVAAREASSHTGKAWWELSAEQQAMWIAEANVQIAEWHSESRFHEARRKSKLAGSEPSKKRDVVAQGPSPVA